MILAAVPKVVAAQVSASASGVAVYSTATIIFQGDRERLGGPGVGAEVTLDLGRATISAIGFRADLQPVDNTTALAREGGEIRGVLSISVVEWFSFEGGYGVRAFSSAAGRQEWKIPSVGARLTGVLGDETLRTYLRASYLPSVRVSGVDSPDLGIAVEAGLVISPGGAPIVLKAHYRLERYDFPGGAASRLEQFETIGFSLGFGFQSVR